MSMYERLRQLTAFNHYSDAQLKAFCKMGKELQAVAGDMLFFEGDAPTGLYVLVDGELSIEKQIGNRVVILARYTGGAFVGEISLLSGVPHTAAGRITKDSLLLHFEPSLFENALDSSPVLRLMITTMVERLRSTEVTVQQNEKLSALGKLSAGLAHELNNPAAASLRAVTELAKLQDTLHATSIALTNLQLQPQQIAFLDQLRIQITNQALDSETLDAIQQSEREDEIEGWLTDHAIEDGWEYAPILVQAGTSPADLEALVLELGQANLDVVLAWLAKSMMARDLMQTIQQGNERIGDLVAAIKSYSYMDQSPVQRVDIHQGLESTLTILKHKLRNVTVSREYDRSLPKITVQGSQLNQVWTNLIDNAIDAMDGAGTLTIRTTREGDQLIVAVIDDGPGIPSDVVERIFEPFFTTKGVGDGSGLGLDIVRRIVVQDHLGDVRVESHPGRTCFTVSLPLEDDTP